jgi:cholesterol oxidase
MSDDLQHYDADFIVIGSGFGGSVSALRLAQKGYKVVVLEQGRRHEPEDFPSTNWSVHKYLWMPRLGFGGIQAISFLRHVLVMHGTGVGGGSLVYANNLIHPPREVFETPEWGDADWTERLAPHFAEARRMLGATPSDGIGRTDELLRQIVSDMPGAGELKLNDVGVFFGEPGVEVGDPYFGGEGPRRVGCTKCAACMIGCRVGAKNTLDRNYLWLAERLGVQIVPEVRATGIETGDEGFVVLTRGSFGRTRRGRRWRAPNVVLAAGVMGSVELLAASRNRGWLPRVSGRLGEFVRTNSEEILIADGRDASLALDDQVAITSGIQADKDTFVEMVRFNRGSDLLFGLKAPLDRPNQLPRLVGLVWTLIRNLPQTIGGLWPFGRAHRSAIVLAMQPTEGHLSLVLRRGWWGMGPPALRSEIPPGQVPPVLRIPVAGEITRRLAEKLGGVAWQNLWTWLAGAPMTAHLLGGCRIGSSAHDGVVDETGQVHGHPGLYVVDGSVVPSNIGVNPSLTITALAEYMMSQLPPAE